MKSLQTEFFREMEKGATAFAQQQDSFELKTAGTSSQTEIILQIELIEALVAQQVDAIVVVPIDSKALVPVIVKAVKSGIKVVNIDIRLDEKLLAENGVELTYVGPDNETASFVVGNVLAGRLHPGAKVIMIEGLPVAENAQQRKKGFLRSISEHRLHLVASEAADWETGKAEKVFDRLFEQYPDVEGVMCCNDAMALGVIRVLEKHGKAGKLPVVGFDNDSSVHPLLDAGALLATIDAFGSRMAVQGIECVLKILAGMENKVSYNTEFVLVQKKVIKNVVNQI